MDPACKTNHLLLSELNYELKLRGITTERPQDEKRKILGRLWSKERQQGLDLVKLSDLSFDFATEKTEIGYSLNSIATLINEFEGPVTDSCYKRAFTRLCHITLRIQRINLDSIADNAEEILKFKNESYATAIKLDADLHEKISESEQVNLNSSTFQPIVNTSYTHPSCSISHKSFPVYKLGIQFEGEPSKLLSFIERVEELALSRHVSKQELFDSAADLFSGKATFWLRHVKPSVSDWDNLMVKLKQDFLKTDFDDELWGQIRSRKQGNNEPVILYISCLDALFNRLSHQVAEITKIKYIKLGLQQDFRERLALVDVDSISALGSLCKRIEESKIVSHTSQNHSKTIFCLADPELAYISNTPGSSNSKVNETDSYNNNRFRRGSYNRNEELSVTKNDKAKPTASSNIICWKCNMPNHTFRHCKVMGNNKFCFKCGSPDVTLKNCLKCKGNE